MSTRRRMQAFTADVGIRSACDLVLGNWFASLVAFRHFRLAWRRSAVRGLIRA